MNNIRSLCARNENPPEPEPVRTAVKRVRASALNSRKISLTCQSLRNPPIESQQVKTDRNLLDPARKSSGRLRSPLPSPIPSPVSSPIPSPSRSRFQVSRVVESTVSPITPPSSNSCSPTSFAPTSRFRVTVVEPPKVMSAPVTIINNSANKETTNESTQTQNKLPQITGMSTSLPSTVPRAKSESPVRDSAKSSRAEAPREGRVGGRAAMLTVLDSMPIVQTTANASFDSPDLEVKSYMDDSCSSFSSLDSIDRGHDLNASMSSMESYEILGGDKTGCGQPETIAEKSKSGSNLSLESAESTKTDNSESSLEVSTCSNDSIYGSQEFPVLKVSSNEGTLTNSPESPYEGDGERNSTLRPQADEKESLPAKGEEKRVRKTSWITRGDAVPATIDKLLSIFQHPGNIFFTRTNNGDVIKKEAQCPQSCSATQQPNDSKPPSRKESPMGGLFAWAKKDNVNEEIDHRIFNAETQPSKPLKSPLQPNTSPENTLSGSDAVNIEALPIKLKRDVKENISPEHTVTADSMANLQTKPVQAQPAAEPSIGSQVPSSPSKHAHPTEVEKVRFEVGGNDDEDDDDELNGDKYENIGASNIQSTCMIPIGARALGLGQISRDSLSILKGSLNNSQDSMQSLDSLSEIVFEDEEKLPPL